MRITFNVRGYVDRRTVDLHRQNDALIEKQWRERVARNPKERARLDRQERAERPLFLLQQAD